MIKLYYVGLCLIITVICAWAVISPRVTAGPLTKFIIGVMSISSFASAGLVWVYASSPTQSEVLFVTSAAAIALRCYWIKKVKPRIRKIRRKCCD